VQWYETFKKSFSTHLTPFSIAEQFSHHVQESERAWIFTSATLAVENSFDHFTEALGLKNPERLLLESPFDFKKQAILYLPNDIPDVNAPNYFDKLVEAAVPVINAAKGRTFFLFTSHYALQAVAKRLMDEVKYPLLIQGSMPKEKLLKTYKDLGDAVLLGTNSFWEGVDVKGEALSCVIIDKLPFASPGEPVIKAKIQAMREAGSDPFNEYQLPKAVLALKQGVGRLIRDVNDRGVMMICDNRLVTKSYGKTFLQSLPNMSKTRKLENVVRFLAPRHSRESGNPE